MAPPHLLTFAQETFDNICGLLPSTRDLKNLRLASRLALEITKPVYIERQFSEIEVDLGPERLDYLLKVSRSDKFSNCVRTIIIEPRDVIPDNARHASPNMIMLRARQAFRDRGHDARVLSEALSNFKNLQGVGIAHYTDSRRFEQNLLIPNTNSVGFFPWIRQSDSALSYAFSVLDRALLRLPSTTLRTLRVGGRPPTAAQRSSIGHLTLQSVGFSDCYANIENLHLVLEITPGSYGVHSEQYLASFLQRTPNLKSLRLELWASSAEWLSETLMNVAFPHLESLHIEAIRFIRASRLKDFISRHAKTLRDIALVNVTFTDDDLVTIFPTIFGLPPTPSTSTDSPTRPDPPTSTSPPDPADPTEPSTPETPSLHLKSLRLQQIASLHSGLLLFDSAGVKTVCDHCMKDLEGNWAFKDGPLCKHGNFEVEGELDTGRKLRAQLAGMSLLPYTLLNRLYFGTGSGVVESEAVVEDVAGDEDGDEGDLV